MVPLKIPALPFGVAVAQLGDLVSNAEHASAVAFLGCPVAFGDEGVLQEGVEVAGAGGAAVHRGEHLDVADGVQPELGGDAVRDDVHDEFGGLLSGVQAGVLGGVAAKPVVSPKPVSCGGWPWLMRCAGWIER